MIRLFIKFPRVIILLVSFTGFASIANAVEGTESPAIAPDLLKLRDPFQRPVTAIKVATKSDLERYPVDAYRLVAVLTGPDRLKALLMAPDGKSHFVSEKMKIGIRNGFIRKIGLDVVYVREKVVNLVGQEETIESEIRLPAEGKPAGGKSAEVKAADMKAADVKAVEALSKSGGQ